jgi:selenide,water dikinase
VLGDLPVSSDPRVLVDFRTSDDAGVYALGARRALVQTVDFFTPIVDDPAAYGGIAAANALSDVYAMGATPLTALAIAAFPKDADPGVMREIFLGGLQTLGEAKVALLGGHTVQDQEIKFGYAVTGEVDPVHLWTNAGARAGDALVLTKPIGTGVIATAIKFGRAAAEIAAAAIASMTRLNRNAAAALGSLDVGAVHACTDVSGFGLVGHATEMARASRVTIEIRVDSVPLLDGAVELVDANTPGGGRTNVQHFGRSAMVDSGVDPMRLQLLYDPQTSGGLLAAIDPRAVDEALRAMTAGGVAARVVGTVEPASTVAVRLRGMV